MLGSSWSEAFQRGGQDGKEATHNLSPKHLDRYIQEFAGRHNIREMDTIRQMEHVVAAMVGHRLRYRELVGG